MKPEFIFNNTMKNITLDYATKWVTSSYIGILIF